MTTTSTLTMTDFVLARIAELARSVDVPEWYCTDSVRGPGWGTRGDCPLCDGYMFDGSESVTEEAFYEHMKHAHDRDRVLAQCAAMRKIVEESVALDGEYAGIGLSAAVRALASIWSDHPDWREEWR
jgi:hypothetical protein